MKKRTKIILAFIGNFIIIGTGFVVLLEGSRGFKLGFIYLIPFLILTIFFVPEKNVLISDISLIGRFLIYIICFVHLYKISKSIES